MMTSGRFFLVTFVAVTNVILEVHSANILIYMGTSSPSHKFAFTTYANELTQRGHKVTFISPFATKGAKFRDVTPQLLESVNKDMMQNSFLLLRLKNDHWSYWKLFPKYSYLTCEAILKSPEVEDIVTGKEKYDLVILDTLLAECGFGFAHVHNSSVIYFCTTGMEAWLAPFFGLPSTAVFIPSSPYIFFRGDIRKLTNRVTFALVNALYEWQRYLWMFPKAENLWEQRLGRKVPSFAEMEKNINLMFMNTHPAVDIPFPYMSNIIAVGGIHIQPNKSLPKDIEEIASGSGDAGFILFSVGTIVQAKNLPRTYYQFIVESFRRLPQRIIWKMEPDEEELTKLPANVFTRKWLPQRDLLAHPKCRGFVTHGGKLSMLEAIHEGVPVVVIPFFADQDLHAAVAHSGGFGIALDITDVTTDSLYEAISRIVQEPRFKEKAVQRSKVFRDQPDTPLSRAMFWTEFVLKHPEAQHFQPAARYFTWYQYHMVDVWALVALLLLVTSVAIILILRCFLSLFSRKASEKIKCS